ncbi:hypothetical protein EDC94DRAFT_584385 [Helicostylum pulchrum]|nr:hypothetical protein EDC94DRAFT_584385 [Helicostylum pulchrum]
MATLNVKEQFIPFAERYLLGDLNDFTVDDVKAILGKDLSNREILVSTNKSKYIKAFILMYMIYIKEDILNKLPDQLIFDHIDTKVGYAISIEAILLNNTIGTKDNLRDITFASGLIPKDNDSKKLRITTQGERILPAIQKSLKLECTLKSYFLLCQLHEVYVQLTLNQVVTAPSSEEQEHKSIIVQEEIVAIPNIYDSLCTSMWQNLVQDSSLIELCEMHKTSDGNDIFGLFSSNIKTEFFINLKGYIFDNELIHLVCPYQSYLANSYSQLLIIDHYAIKISKLVLYNKTFYLWKESAWKFSKFDIGVSWFKAMNYLENNETLSRDDNIYLHVDTASVYPGMAYKGKGVKISVMVSVSYVYYTSSLQFSIKLIVADTGDVNLTGVIEAAEPLTLTRLKL